MAQRTYTYRILSTKRYRVINIVCVLRQGGKVGYDATWVDKLHNNVQRNLSHPFRFICLSDCEVNCERIPLTSEDPGYWAKLELFRENLFDGPVLFFDLDTLICNNIDLLVEQLMAQDSFVMWKDTDYNLSSSAIMYWNGDYSHIYKEYLKDPAYYQAQYSQDNQGPARLVGDQAVISLLVPHTFINDLCPTNWIHVANRRDADRDLSETRILIFRKNHSKPSTMTTHQLVKEHWK